MAVVAGVDSSTQSCKVEIRDVESGELLGEGQAPHPVTTPPVSEQPVDAWWTAFGEAFQRALTAANRKPSEVVSISVAAQCHGMVLLDDHGRSLRAVKLWNDTTSSPQAARMVESLGKAYWAKNIGSVPTAAFTITKLAWLAQNEPEVLKHVSNILLPHDYLTYRLTGRFVTDRSEASGTGYYAAHEGRWRTDLLDHFVDSEMPWEEMLPEVLEPSDLAGFATTREAASLGLSPNTLVGAGAGDQHAGAVGMGLKPGEVLYSLGTSGVVMTPSLGSVHDSAGWIDGVADATGGYLPLVCTLNSAKVTDFTARILNVNHDELSRLALEANVSENRPVFTAFLEGERTPDLPYASGVLGGIRTTTSREDVALAAYEGVLLGLVRGQRAIEASGVSTSDSVFVTGGGARSLAYRQVLADILDSPVHVRDVSEATARGAATQAAAIFHQVSITDMRDQWQPKIVNTTVPRQYEGSEVFERYLELARFLGDDPWENK